MEDLELFDKNNFVTGKSIDSSKNIIQTMSQNLKAKSKEAYERFVNNYNVVSILNSRQFTYNDVENSVKIYNDLIDFYSLRR